MDTDWRQEKETGEGSAGPVTHQSDALRVAAKLADVFLQQIVMVKDVLLLEETYQGDFPGM